MQGECLHPYTIKAEQEEGEKPNNLVVSRSFYLYLFWVFWGEHIQLYKGFTTGYILGHHMECWE